MKSESRLQTEISGSENYSSTKIPRYKYHVGSSPTIRTNLSEPIVQLVRATAS